MRKYTDKIKFFIKYLFVLRGILTTQGDGDPVPDPRPRAELTPRPASPPEQKWPGSLPVPGRGPRLRPTLDKSE